MNDFFEKMKMQAYRFMYGRYGADKLGNVLIIAYGVVLVIHTVLSLVMRIVNPMFNMLWIDLSIMAV